MTRLRPSCGPDTTRPPSTAQRDMVHKIRAISSYTVPPFSLVLGQGAGRGVNPDIERQASTYNSHGQILMFAGLDDSGKE